MGGLIQLRVVARKNNIINMVFNTDAGQSYNVERTDDPVNGPWTVFQSNLAGTGDFIGIIDSALPSEMFYRVRLVP